MMKRFASISVLLICISLLVSCSALTPTTLTPTTLTPTTSSPIDSLTTEQKILYDIVISNLVTFYNPSQVRILNIDKAVNEDIGAIKIQGTNKAGGTLTQTYFVDYSDKSMNEDLLDVFVFDLSKSSIWTDAEVGAINKALAQHWKDMGVD